MQVHKVYSDSRIPSALFDIILSDVDLALNCVKTTNDEFVVNDTIWYQQTPQGKITPSVVNSAKFITSVFQNAMLDAGWDKEKELNGQRIDGYKEFVLECLSFRLDEDRFLPMLQKMRDGNKINYGSISTQIFSAYVESESPYILDDMLEYSDLLSVEKKKIKFRIGMEFETGNIASSFRAIQKLDGLYSEKYIDFGLFITSINKSTCSTRIWPSSNRNGSFEELDQRNYKNQRSYPSIDVGFSPDRFDKNAPYLSDKGTTYQMTNLHEVTLNGGSYLEGNDYQNAPKLQPL
jgi:hypothetical protein